MKAERCNFIKHYTYQMLRKNGKRILIKLISYRDNGDYDIYYNKPNSYNWYYYYTEENTTAHAVIKKLEKDHFLEQIK